MVIDQIELEHFRNYEHLHLFPHERINLFFGRNGSGKTNLLEAIHYCALGKSHRISQDSYAVMNGERSGSCALSVQGKWTRNNITVTLLPGESAVKSVCIDQKKVKKLSEMMGVLRCVMFSPEDLNLIREGPAARRRFLDMMISQLSRPYFIALQQYRIAMEQRNAILRISRIETRPIDPMIEDFEKAMAEHAWIIYQERKKYTDQIESKSLQLYQKISGREDEHFLVQYRGFIKNETAQKDTFREMLAMNRNEDLKQGMTTAGPHRDDLQLSLNKKNMKLFASQGQMRTAALSLKLSQLQIITDESGESPVLLLDDVMSELDLKRRMNLLAEIGNTQTFITFSDEGDLEESQFHRTYYVFSNHGIGQIEEKKTGPAMKETVLTEPDFS